MLKHFLASAVPLTGSTILYGQQVADVNLTGDMKIEPGTTNLLTISVKNKQAVSKRQPV